MTLTQQSQRRHRGHAKAPSINKDLKTTRCPARRHFRGGGSEMSVRGATLCSVAMLLLLGGTASAQQLTYTPINPTFGGNPFNSSHLLALANAQNQFQAKQTTTAEPTQAQQFATQLQSTILAGVAQQISNAIFGDNPANSGSVSFGGTNVSFLRGLGNVTVNITDPTGVTTTIVVPTFQTTATGG